MNSKLTYRLGHAALAVAILLAFLPAVASAEGNLELTEPKTNAQPRVSVTLTATGENGLPIFDLTPEQLEVTENGVVQEDVVVYPFYERPTPVDTVLALDASSSMRGEPLEQAKAAAIGFVNNMGGDDRTGIVSFGKSVKVEQPLTGDATKLEQAINRLKVSPMTPLYDALVLAAEEADRTTNPRAIVLLTDGANWGSKLTADEALERVQAIGVPVFTVGFGKKAARQPLERIADSTGGKYYSALSGSQLQEIFTQISKQLRQDYRLSYKSSTAASAGSNVEVRVRVRRDDFDAEQGFEYEYAVRENARRAGVPVATGNLRVVNEGQAAQQAVVMPGGSLALPLGTALATFLFSVGAWLAGTQSRVQKRLESYISAPDFIVTVRGRSSSLAVIMRPVVRVASSIMLRILPAKHQRQLAENLAAAGHPYRWRLSQFVTFKALAAVLPSGFILLTSGNLLIAGALFGLGFYLPNFWLAKKVKQRSARILLQMPDALDLLTISVEAGLGFDAAIAEVVQKWDNDIATEFGMVLSEMKLGKSRREALKSMAKRIDIPEMKIFVGAIVQAEEIGMGISRALSIQAEQMRLRRRQKAEEKAHKAVIKILLPMVFFIFPAIFVVLLGPAVPGMLQAFAGLGK